MDIKRLIKYVVYSYGIIAALVFGFVYVYLSRFEFPPSSVVDLAQYESILKEWKESVPEIVSHFPETIPSDVQNAEFYFEPGLMQADPRIELRYKTSSENIQTLYEKFSKQKTKLSYGGVFCHRPPEGGNGNIIELGTDWETMEFEEDPDHLPEHSSAYGVIISREKNEIIYWANW
jgi:hypothetical protein